MAGPSPRLTPDRWARVKQAFEQVLDAPPDDRAALLDILGTEDGMLALEVRQLLAAHDAAGSFIETPALARKGMAAALVSGLEEAPAWTGRRVGPYLLTREIGRGGMGAVYLGVRVDDEYRKEVAVKVIRSSFEPASIQQRFRHERQILADLDHPNIARLLDGGSTDEGAPYFVMEYVDGLPIDQYCAVQHLTIEGRLTLFLQVCAAVHFAHQHLVVHRDLKGSNILVGADGAPKLLDFGIAKVLGPEPRLPEDRTETVLRPMSLESASPEQIRGDAVTTRTDVYALGVMLHRLLTGRGPYSASATTTTHDLARAICDEEPRRPSESAGSAAAARRLRGDLDTIVLKALQKNPERRYESVDQFAQDIRRHLAGHPVVARPDTVRYRATKFLMRHRAGAAATALIVLSLLAGVIATAWQAHVAREQRRRAERRFDDVRRLATSFLFEFHDAIEALPGSTRARELVVRRASEYLDSLASEAGSDPSLQREVAAAYEKVGDVQGLPSSANLGDTAGALASHRRALALRQPLAGANPADAALQGELAATYTHLSEILATRNELPAALEHARKALDIRQPLQARNPDDPAGRTALAVAYHHIGVILSDMSDWDGALEYVRREAREFDALLALDRGNPRAQRNAAIAYRRLGALVERGGDPATALQQYRKAAALDQARVQANPDDVRARLDLSYDYASVGYTLSQTGDIKGSLEQYGLALEQRERASAADPHDVNARDTVVRAHLSIAQVLRTAGRQSEALPHYHKARTLAAARYAADPGNVVVGERLAHVYGGLAAVHAALAPAATTPGQAAGHWRETRAWTRKSLDIWAGRTPGGGLQDSARREVEGLSALLARADAALAGVRPAGR